MVVQWERMRVMRWKEIEKEKRKMIGEMKGMNLVIHLEYLMVKKKGMNLVIHLEYLMVVQ